MLRTLLERNGITMPGNSEQKAGITAVRLNLETKVSDMHPHQIRTACITGIIPQFSQQPFTAENLAGMAHQVVHQIKLNRG